LFFSNARRNTPKDERGTTNEQTNKHASLLIKILIYIEKKEKKKRILIDHQRIVIARHIIGFASSPSLTSLQWVRRFPAPMTEAVVET
jgi:hypothetical protein